MIRIFLCVSLAFVMSCSDEQDPEIPKDLEELGMRLGPISLLKVPHKSSHLYSITTLVMMPPI